MYFTSSEEERQARAPAIREEDDQEQRQEVEEAFQAEKAPAPDEVMRELKPLFDGLGKALRDRNRDRILAHFDPERMIDELLALGVLPPELRRQRANFQRGFVEGMGVSLVQRAPLLEWRRSEIRSVKVLNAHEAVAIVRHWGNEGDAIRMRWWVSKRQETWKIFDLENLEFSMRYSTALGALAGGAGLGDLRALGNAVQHLTEVQQILVTNRDLDAAEAALRKVPADRLPKMLDCQRLLLWGLVRLHQKRTHEALDNFQRVGALHPDMPCLDLFRGVAFNDLGQWEIAWKHLEAYRNLLGDDSTVCYEIGEALRGLGRLDEARASYRKSLDFHPKNLDAFVGLLRALGPDDRGDEIARRFSKLDDARGSFDVCVADCWQARDGEAVIQLALAMRKIDPAYASAHYYLVLGKIITRKTDEAARLFPAALAMQKDALLRPQWLKEFMKTMAGAGKAAEAYEVVPEPRKAFAFLAVEAKNMYFHDDLRRLMAAHARKHANDPALEWFKADLHAQEGEYELAEKRFAAAPPLATKDLSIDTFRGSRVLARFHTRGAVSAYNDIPPRPETFQQLALLCLQENKHGELEKLLDAHAKLAADAPELSRYRWRLKARQGHVDEAVALFKAALAKEPDEQRKRLASDFLFDLVDEGHALRAYEAAPDAREAFRQLAPELLDSQRHDDARKLIAAHAKRDADDPSLAIYSAELFVSDKAWEKAVKVIQEGIARVPELRNQTRWMYVLAMFKQGKGLQAYREDPSKEVRDQLINLCFQDKKVAELEALLELQRIAGEDADLFFNQARVQTLAGRPDAAIALYQKACEKQPLVQRRRIYLDTLVHELSQIGKGLEAYAAAHDKQAAFETLGRNFVSQKRPKDLAALLALHRKKHADDAWSHFFAGELELLRANPQEADKHFRAALAKGSPTNEWSLRDGLHRAGIKAGKAVAVYNESARDDQTFQSLAQLCLMEKDGRQLEALLGAHRATRPEDVHLRAWEVDLKWLNGDFAGALKLLDEHAAGLFALPRHLWKADNYRVRCLVKLGKADDAVKAAREHLKARRGNSMLLLLALAARGDVQEVIAEMEKSRRDSFWIEDCYRDGELGPFLRSERFQPFRERFPEPKANAPL